MADTTRFTSVAEMVRATSDDAEFIKDVERRIAQRQLLKHLVAHRVKSGMSQKDVADKCECTQSRISKLESSTDEDTRLGDLAAYADAIEMQVRTTIAPRSHTVVDEIKYHAFVIKKLLEQLVDLTGGDKQIADGVLRFVCIETPLNLLKIVVDTAKQIPQQFLEHLPGLVVEDECMACEQEDVPEPQRL